MLEKSQGQVFSEETTHSNHYIQLFLSLFFRELTEQEKNV
jgi:hypothetical protein